MSCLPLCYKNPKIYLLREIWVSENDNQGENNLQAIYPFDFARSERKQRSGRVAFIFENSVKYKPLKFVIKLDNSQNRMGR